MTNLYNPNTELFLPPMSVNADNIVTTGISGGAFMANQLHVIYSDQIKGAGLMLGGPYGSYNNGSGKIFWSGEHTKTDEETL